MRVTATIEQTARDVSARVDQVATDVRAVAGRINRVTTLALAVLVLVALGVTVALVRLDERPAGGRRG